MGWNARAAHLVRRLSVALCAALIVCVVGAVYAAGATVTPRSTGYYRMGTNAVGGTRFGTRTEFAALWENALGGSVSRSVTAVGELVQPLSAVSGVKPFVVVSMVLLLVLQSRASLMVRVGRLMS